MEKQTAGRKALGDFAPQFAALNDDVLFGEVWAKENELSPKLRSIATVSALVGKGTAGDALRYHLQTARQHGVTREEMAALLNTSVRSVETARYRLRKKLNLEQGENLTNFIKNFDTKQSGT